MSFLRRSTGRELESVSSTEPTDDLLQVEPSEFRPMSSHARIEGMYARRAMDKLQLREKERTPRQQRKMFLPQLSQATSFPLDSPLDAKNHANDADDTEEGAPAGDVDTDAFKKAMWAGQANILVTVRLRPHLAHDRASHEIVRVLDHKVIVVLDAASDAATGAQNAPVRRHTSHPIRKLRNAPAPATQRRSREKRFAFDYVFAPEDGQQTVYSHTTRFLIHGVLNGFNATVFAYGNTGAGKTYTMLGTPDQPGIMALTLDDLFHNIERVHADIQSNVTYRVTVSFLEVYNENIRDLLVNPSASSTIPGASGNDFLDLREDPIKGPIVAGISEIEACNAMEVMKLLRKGNKHRSQEATAANAVSSRSHAVLQVLVEQREKTSVPHVNSETTDEESASGSRGDESITTVVKFGKLSLVDLAGSERAAVTQNRGQRLLEGANINRSLLALGNCINALGEKGASAASFVPYRDSKLTRLLKDSLGGNCRTVMIANISLAAASVEETLNTLKYANRAKNIKTTVTRNVLNVDHHITEYVGVISGLKDEIAALKKQLVRQQDAINPSPCQRVPRQMCPIEDNNNHEENNDARLNDDRPKTEMMQERLRDVRRHIIQYFSDRLQLRESLLQIDFQIQEITQLPQTPLITAGAKSEENLDSTTPRPEIEVATLEMNQDEMAVPDISATKPHQNGHADGLLSSKALEELEVLTSHKRSILHQLGSLEERIEEFHSAVLESPSLTENELCREILLMEYRVGNLEIEKMELQMARKIKDSEIDNLKGRISVRAKNHSGTGNLLEKKQPELLRLPMLTQLSPKFSSTQPPDIATANAQTSSVSAQVSSQLDSPKSTLGFMDDLRGRLCMKKPSQEDAHPRQASTNQGSGSAASARKQWGIHLASTTLPYIRLKKKSPTGDMSSLASTIQAVTVPAPKPSSASITAPYLRVLKHRRKSHQGSKKTASSSSSRKKDTLEHAPTD